jgi:hypothetical protein
LKAFQASGEPVVAKLADGIQLQAALVGYGKA